MRRALLKGALRARLIVNAVGDVGHASEDGGEVAVMPGDPAGTAALRDLLGSPAEWLPPDQGLVVFVASPDHHPAEALRVLATRWREGGPVLVILTGTPARRRMVEQEAIEAGIGIGQLAHVASIDEAGGRPALQAVARGLGPGAVAAARRNPRLRRAVTRALAQGAAREAGAMGAVGLMPANTITHARLVTQLAAANGRTLGVERAPEVAAVVVAGVALRAVAGRAARVVGVPPWLVRGGVSYVSTIALADAATRWLAAGGEAADRPLTALKAAVTARVGSSEEGRPATGVKGLAGAARSVRARLTRGGAAG